MKRFALVALLCGCAHAPPPVPRWYPAPDASVLLDALRLRSEKLHTLGAEARAEQSGPGHPRVRAKVSAWVERPDRLRLEIEGPLGTGAATMTSDGARVSLLDTRASRLFTGAARGCNIARLVQVELEPAQAVTVLSGEVPLEAGPASVSWDEHEGGRELVTIHTSDGGQEKVWLDGREKRWDPLRADRLDARGKLVWRIEHSDFTDVQGRRLPGTTSVRDARRNAEIKLRWKERDLDPQLREDGFRLEPGPGVVAEPVDCQ